MNYAEAQDIWNKSETVARGVHAHKLSTHVRLVAFNLIGGGNNRLVFSIKHRNGIIISYYPNGEISLHTGYEPRFRSVRRGMINKYVPAAATLHSFYDGIVIVNRKAT